MTMPKVRDERCGGLLTDVKRHVKWCTGRLSEWLMLEETIEPKFELFCLDVVVNTYE
jgi:hypothetical protein